AGPSALAAAGADPVLVTNVHARLAAAAATVVELVAAGRAQSTRRAYGQRWRHFADWCAKCGYATGDPPRVPMPIDPLLVALYLGDMANRPQDTALSTLEGRLTAINAVSVAAGHAPPGRDPLVREAVAGLRRSHPRPPRGRPPLRLDDLRQVVSAAIDQANPLAAARDRAVILLAFRRRSEVSALDCADLALSARQLTIVIRRSKTDQQRRGEVLRIPALPGGHAELCVLSAVRDWLAAADLTALAGRTAGTGVPLFYPLTRGGRLRRDLRLSGEAVARIVRVHATAAGLDPEFVADLAAHSVRAGAATDALQAGEDPYEVARMLGHAGLDTLRVYDRRLGAGGDALTRARTATGGTDPTD
ncbi:MAG TPA: tyrosine-type recombinase/integrase, partial [Mycobacteriales bacterium]